MFIDAIGFKSFAKDELKVLLFYALAFLICFYFFYGLSSLVYNDDTVGMEVAFAWEKNIPFIPEFAWIYNSLALLLSCSLFIIRKRDRVHGYFIVLCAQVIIASIIFLWLPIEKTFPPRYGAETLPWIFILADTVNLDHNDFPSLHVCLAFTASLISARYVRPLYALLLIAWAVLIALSTMLIHEHHFIDVAGGLVLSLIGAVAYAQRSVRLSGMQVLQKQKSP